MPDTRIQKTKTKLVRVYGVGLLAFASIVGLVTLLARFLANLNTT